MGFFDSCDVYNSATPTWLSFTGVTITSVMVMGVMVTEGESMASKTQVERNKRYRAKIKETAAIAPALQARVAELEAETGQLRDKLEATKRIGDLAKSLQSENKRLKAGEAAIEFSISDYFGGDDLRELEDFRRMRDRRRRLSDLDIVVDYVRGCLKQKLAADDRRARAAVKRLHAADEIEIMETSETLVSNADRLKLEELDRVFAEMSDPSE